MRTVIQRVSQASVTIDGNMKSEIGKGLLVLLGICDDDNEEDIDWLVRKIVQLRVFDDENGVMNRSVTDIQGELGTVNDIVRAATGTGTTVLRPPGGHHNETVDAVATELCCESL